MTIEITADERAVLMASVMAYKLDSIRYLGDFPKSALSDGVRKEIEIADSLYEKIFNCVFE